MDNELIEEAYLQCQQICKNASTTFYSSFSALGQEKRKAVHAVYALCRWVDDIVDGDEEPIVYTDDELIQQPQNEMQSLENYTREENHQILQKFIFKD